MFKGHSYTTTLTILHAFTTDWCAVLMLFYAVSFAVDIREDEKYYIGSVTPKLTQVPDDIPWKTKSLSIDGNAIAVLSNESFTNLSVCLHLFLDNNQISKMKLVPLVALTILKLWT